MSCPKGQKEVFFPFSKVPTCVPDVQASAYQSAINKEKTANSKSSDKEKKNGTSAFDWVTGILGVLGAAAPAVILATKGGQVPTTWNQDATEHNPYGNATDTKKPSSTGGSMGGVPQYVWYIVGGVVLLIVGVVLVKAMAKKP